MSEKLTILTPTFNRPDRLMKLFNSLQKQTLSDFTWWVINDGSTVSYQSTEINVLNSKRQFDVKFFHKKNGGKHRALNFMIPKIETDLTIIIDDDDFLVEDAVETILRYSKEYFKPDNNIRTMVFEHAFNDAITPMVKIPKKIDFGRRHQYIIKNKLNGDFAEVFDTKSLKEFRLPEFEGENFISEGTLYFEFSQKYEAVFIQKIISAGSYNSDGLSHEVHNLMAKNLQGSLYEINLFLSIPNPMYYKVKKGLLYGFLMFKNKKSIYYSVRNAPSILTSLLVPAGYLIGMIRR